jgi:hypothetical protein
LPGSSRNVIHQCCIPVLVSDLCDIVPLQCAHLACCATTASTDGECWSLSNQETKKACLGHQECGTSVLYLLLSHLCDTLFFRLASSARVPDVTIERPDECWSPAIRKQQLCLGHQRNVIHQWHTRVMRT